MSHTLLVVDDEGTTRRLVMYTLRSLNVDVIGAEDGASALEIASQHEIHMMLVDLNLPIMDGFSLIAKLKAMPQLRDVPLVAFTARNHPEDEAQVRELGAAGFLYKPFSTQELRALVSRHLGLA